MISSEVQRTLVKSPPELWAEISDPEALARHLGEFGEIRITRVDPERGVEWEARDASGTVVIKPSGWGTKVKLTVKRVLAQSEADAAQADPGEETAYAASARIQPPAALVEEHGETEPQDPVKGEIEEESEPPPPRRTSAPSPIDRPATHAGFALGSTHAAEHAPAAAGAEPESEAAIDEGPGETEQESALAAEAESEAEPQLEPRRGFFARLFGRRGQATPSATAPALLSPHVGELAAEPELELAAEPEPEPELPLEPAPAPAAEPYEALATWAPELRGAAEAAGGEAAEDDDADARTAEEIAVEEVTAVLTGVLDRLGAAHHRPFSRA